MSGTMIRSPTMSTATSTISYERNGALAVLRIDKARGNAIDAALVEDLARLARQIDEDDGVRGALLASAHPKLFCPGLDLVSLMEYDRTAMRHFMGRFAETLWTLYGLRKPVVAAISGHAVAGGCILALTADMRVLRRSGAQMGLNEVRLGVPLPWSVALLVRATVPPASFAPVALLGRNFEGEQALAAGLVDALADAEGFEAACLARLEELAEKDTFALGTTKSYLRAGILDQMRAREGQALEEFLDAWFSEATRQRMRETLASLKTK